MRIFLTRLLILSFGIFFNSFANNSSMESCPSVGKYNGSFYLDDKKIDLYASHPFNVGNDCIEDLIIAIHGNERNVPYTFDSIFQATQSVAKEQKTLIIVPFFKTTDDLPSLQDYFWSNSGWKQGNTSNNSGPQISSFEITDIIINFLIETKKVPNLKNITILGHSAGGQYTQRYALTSPIAAAYTQFDFQFLVLNPSSYTYINGLRPHPTKVNLFEIPITSSGKMKPDYKKVAGECAKTYNDYKYGLEDKNAYGEMLSNDELIAQYIHRNVFYFLGSLDIDDDDSLDETCEARLQGKNRLERGKNQFNLLETFYRHTHTLQIIENVGHESRKMYNDPLVKQVLFRL